MDVIPYLGFDGTCAEAFRFYEAAIGAKVDMMMRFADSPMADHVPPGAGERIVHASMTLSGSKIMGGDAPPGSFSPMAGFCVNLQVETEAEAERLFGALADGGAIRMPIAETFWAKRFGMVTDKFGTPWMINCAKPM